MYRRYLRVRMIPKLPIFLAMTLSSKESSPSKFDCFTSFRHLAHLCTAYLVRPTRKGMRSKLRTPKTRIPKTARRYPNKLVS